METRPLVERELSFTTRFVRSALLEKSPIFGGTVFDAMETQYLQRLQVKNKWHHEKRNLGLIDIALVRDEEGQSDD